MTREEALRILDTIPTKGDEVDALEMAIEALERKVDVSTDTISRQAVIDALHTQFRDGFDGNKWWNSTHVLAAIEGVPSAESRWIPVTERLPEDGTEVWVTTDMLFEVTRACWHKDSNLWCHPYHSDCLLVLRPIAWMEMSIPKPYKGGMK